MCNGQIKYNGLRAQWTSSLTASFKLKKAREQPSLSAREQKRTVGCDLIKMFVGWSWESTKSNLIET